MALRNGAFFSGFLDRARATRIPAAGFLLSCMMLVSPCLARDAASRREKAGELVKRLLAVEDPSEASDGLVGLGIAAVRPLLDAMKEEEASDRKRRIEEVLGKLAGVEESFDLPSSLADPVTKGSVKLDRSDGIVFPSVSDDAGRICVALRPEDDDKSPKVIVLDREEEKIRAVIDGMEPRLSSNGRMVVFLRPVGDPIRFYATFYTSTTSVYLPDTRGAFDLVPDPRDNHFNLTLSSNGLRVAFQARLRCFVHSVKQGAPPILECEGKLPALSPDGKWLAWLDETGRVALSGVDDGKHPRCFGPMDKGSEVREIRALSRGLGVVFTAGPAGKPKKALLWGFRAETGAWGVLAAVKGCTDLSVSDSGRIVFRASGVHSKRGFAGKTERVASRAVSAGISPGGHFVVYIKGRSVRTVFIGH